MATMIPAPGVPTGGSSGSTTIGRNRYGSYVRNRTKPVNPNSPRQARSRAIFSACIAAWQAMSGVQRAAWENWATLTPWLNRAGETVHLTGQVAFNRHYSAAMQATYPSVPASGWLAPPVDNDVGAIAVSLSAGEIEYDPVTGAFVFTIHAPAGSSNTWAATGGMLIVEMTPGQNATRNFAGARYSQLFENGENNLSSFAWAANDVALSCSADPGSGPMRFPYGLSIGQIVWLRCRGVSPVADRRVTTQQILGPFPIVAVTP